MDDSERGSRSSEAPLEHFGRTPPMDDSHWLNRPGHLTRQQLRFPHQVVGRSHQVPRQTSTLHSPIPSPPEPTQRIHPTEDRLHSLANLLTRLIPRMPRRSPIYRRVDSLCHVRRHPAITHIRALSRVVALVASQGSEDESPVHALRPPALAQHRAPMCPSRC